MDEWPDNRFYAQFPLWFLAERSTLDVREGVAEAGVGSGTGFIGGEAGDTAFVAVFTDTDLAERFLEQNGLTDAVILEINDPRHFLELIDRFPDGITHIGFDPVGVGSTARFLVTLDEAVRTLRRTAGESPPG